MGVTILTWVIDAIWAEKATRVLHVTGVFIITRVKHGRGVVNNIRVFIFTGVE
jgi:hypothetical protein